LATFFLSCIEDRILIAQSLDKPGIGTDDVTAYYSIYFQQTLSITGSQRSQPAQ
jgi:hypothetical protein